MSERAAHIRAARVYLREARMRGRNPAQRGVCFVLLSWAASARRKAAAVVQVAQLELFQEMEVTK